MPYLTTGSTELKAVNQILASVGQAPVTTLTTEETFVVSEVSRFTGSISGTTLTTETANIPVGTYIGGTGITDGTSIAVAGVEQSTNPVTYNYTVNISQTVSSRTLTRSEVTTRVETQTNPDVAIALNTLREVSREVQAEGWSYNTEFDYKITAFHHAVEAYKIADLLAENNICAALWADWWGFKHEAYDMVQANVAIVDQARNGTGCAIVHSDDEIGIQHLNIEASKALSAGIKAGFNISKARAMKWITSNPAKAAGIYKQTGSLKVGKNADVVVWSKNPFSIYALAEKVYIDGALAFDKATGFEPNSDFDIGIINPSNKRIEE